MGGEGRKVIQVKVPSQEKREADKKRRRILIIVSGFCYHMEMKEALHVLKKLKQAIGIIKK